MSNQTCIVHAHPSHLRDPHCPLQLPLRPSPLMNIEVRNGQNWTLEVESDLNLKGKTLNHATIVMVRIFESIRQTLDLVGGSHPRTNK
ncbi:MAG: hypothetical protein L0Z50_30400 [Verrucomicrobiales bacterium]|nr:hypothetical protein [Verrucomicrobiales bacterium]